MRSIFVVSAFVGLIAISAATPERTLFASGPECLEALNPFRGTPVDVHCSTDCNTCGHEFCIDRKKVEECVTGEKKVYKSSVRKQYVSIPEVRYRYRMQCVTKEVPCDYDKPVCKTEEVDHQYQVEHWEKEELPCGSEHICKSCETKTEKLPVVGNCQTKPGKTTVKVHVWTCVKEPYTVYRQVEQEVGVLQPRHEKAEVTVCRHVCEHCGGLGCEFCKQHPDVPSSTNISDPSAIDRPRPDEASQSHSN